MAKLSQSAIKAKADEWAVIEAKIRKAESVRNAELEPFIEQHEAATKPVYDQHNPKIDKLLKKQWAVEKEVIAWLTQHGKPIAVAGEKAVAANETKIGPRVIDVQRFFERVKEKNAAFWECVSVAILKAEKLVGKKTVDAISTKDATLVPTLKLK